MDVKLDNGRSVTAKYLRWGKVVLTPIDEDRVLRGAVNDIIDKAIRENKPILKALEDLGYVVMHVSETESVETR